MSVPVACDVRTFWWDAGRPAHAAVEPLKAVIFDLDGALADVERDGQRLAFNAAFAAHGLDISWTVEEYGRLMCIGDEQRRIASALRRRGFGRVSAEIAAHVSRTKNDLFEASVLNGDVTARTGLEDLVNSLFFAGVPIAVVSTGSRTWVEPLVRQLVGDGIAETVVTPDDLPNPGREPDLHGYALWELGLAPESALAVAGTHRGLRAARAAKLATLVVTTGYSIGGDFACAAEVRSEYDGLLSAGCELMHRRWQTTGR
ncbi:HAD hydrolase-like protein [Mycobacterium sp. AZCC_0083]|uniref:HAD hydrolase-like protein n=1 Tax=Mycobacterium sp. AZCC_0083 TaxID=2735882 RepID=UPI0017E5F708|nr:HAD family hydrolase [Mycobacterium sp. AZCC_0083]MBB5164437.1 beta-phosphoglucomutase-like phosphatase (HAD superfamily) [Mycobacterium sp. AZCC_0083]